MRLLKTKLISELSALEIEEFDDISIPTYAILSHRWGNDEPTLQDVERGITAKEGFKKVRQSCDIAKREGIDYIWIDTCCIDKTSSAELSEAINSMYLWYFKAHRCYAYLSDVPSKSFEKSEWFTRGWTLQELLAPADLVFFDAEWQILGTRDTLQTVISSCTGIPVGILSGDEDLETCSIAQRMSWAAKRSTKRVEDLAYCLLGIFGIHMPLLYGEGERAFTRLQEEIMGISDDHSLFAWESPDNLGGLLATSPAAFKGSGNIVQLSHVDHSHNTLTTSSRGVHLDFRLIGKGAERLGLALLQCKERDGSNNQIGIYLEDLTGTMETFQRVRSEELQRIDLTKTRSLQYLMRRACIQTSRIIPIRRSKNRSEIDAIKKYEPYDNDLLEQIINRAQPEALLHASQEGYQDDVWLMLTCRDVDVNARRRYEWSLLFHAVNNGHEVVAKMLLARGADIKLVDKDGYSPLILATEQGHEDMVKLLLERGADIMEERVRKEKWRIFDEIISLKDENMSAFIKEIRNVSGEKHDCYRLPVFVWAAKHQQENIFKLLLDRSTEVDLKKNYGPILLKWAARGGHTGIAGWLLDRGVEVNLKSPSYHGMAPVSMASLFGNEDTLEVLLEKGAIIETKDVSGLTPILIAVEHEHYNVAKLLLENGANFEAKDNSGRTPLLLASLYGNEDILKLLLEKGADIEAVDNFGHTSISFAAQRKADNIIELLLEKGANIDGKNKFGQTPLLFAAIYEHNDTVKLLLDKGADIEAKDNSGQTPLLAVINGNSNVDTVKLLLERGVNIEARDNNCQTPLLKAVDGYTNVATVKLLLEKGASIEAKDNNGQTPLSWATVKGHKDREAARLLLAKGINIETEENKGRTLLSWATKLGKKEIDKRRIDKGVRGESKESI
jgi:ankyrin repeat protein